MGLDDLDNLGFAFAFLGLFAALFVGAPAFVFSRAALRWAQSRHARRLDTFGPRSVSLVVLWISGVPAVYVSGLFFGLGLEVKTLLTLAVALAIALSNLVHAAYHAECIVWVNRDPPPVELRFAGALRRGALGRAALVFLVFATMETAALVLSR